ncbi:MAG: hypothetical protein ACQETE_06095 [Bacteroidota bacterium]
MITPIALTPAWLDAREPLDSQARSPFIKQQFSHLWRLREHINIIDLLAGTGAYFRDLSPHLSVDQHWTLYHSVDLAPQEIQKRFQSWADEHAYNWDHSDAEGTVFFGDHQAQYQLVSLEEPYDWPALDLSNIHALVSTDGWGNVTPYLAMQMISQAAEEGVTWLSSMIYNSHIQWKPGDSKDAQMLDILHRSMKDQTVDTTDQHPLPNEVNRDESVSAMGDEAPVRLQQLLANQRYLVHESDTFWNISPQQDSLLRSILQCYRLAAESVAQGDEFNAAQQWLDTRSYELAAGKLCCEIGFSDLLAKPLPKHYRKPQ